MILTFKYLLRKQTQMLKEQTKTLQQDMLKYVKTVCCNIKLRRYYSLSFANYTSN